MFSHMSLYIYLHEQKENLNFNDSRGFSGVELKLHKYRQRKREGDFEGLKGTEMPFKKGGI